jgi:hypothetical protein
MPTVYAVQSFTHGAIKARRGEWIEVSSALAGELSRAGLVRPDADVKKNPTPSGPEPLSAALPVAPVFPPMMSSGSESGVKRKRGRPRKSELLPVTTPTN